MPLAPHIAQVTITAPAVATAVGCAAALGVAGWLVVAYNRLVRHRNLVAEAFGGIDVQLKRRHDLVPNLVAAVRGYADFERSLLEDITRLRTQATADPDTAIADRKTHENALTDRLRTLFALAEAYPDLKANANFAQLSTQLVEIEDALQYARRYYNGSVRDYNVAVESFPSRLVAGAFDFDRAEFFEVQTVSERAAPKIAIENAR